MRLEHLWYALLLAVPAAFVVHYAAESPVLMFITAGAAIVPLAALMGRATDALATRLGPRLGGLLNATFGNAAELILALIALRRGLTVLVKASLTGSIIGNALLVLGMSFFVGGLRHRKQTFDRLSAGLQATLLVLAAVGLVVPSTLYHLIGHEAEVELSSEVSIVLVIVYVLSLVYSFNSARQPNRKNRADRRASRWRGTARVGKLAVGRDLCWLRRRWWPS